MNKNIFTTKFITISLLILFAALCRIVTNNLHIWNFTPLVAVCLFSAARLKDWRTAFVVPMAAMLISDLALGLSPAYYIYLIMILITLIGFSLNENSTGVKMVFTAGISSVLFFLISNLVVWMQSPELAKNGIGLMDCYTMALPFYKNQIAGDLFYMLFLFGTFELLKTKAPKLVQG